MNILIKCTSCNEILELNNIDSYDKIINSMINVMNELKEEQYVKEEDHEKRCEEICKLKNNVINLLNEISDLKIKIDNKGR